MAKFDGNLCIEASLKADNADGSMAVILYRQAGKDDRGDAREHHGDLFVQPAFGDHGQAQDDAIRHISQQRGIACQRAGQRAGKTGIDGNYRHDRG